MFTLAFLTGYVVDVTVSYEMEKKNGKLIFCMLFRNANQYTRQFFSCFCFSCFILTTGQLAKLISDHPI